MNQYKSSWDQSEWKWMTQTTLFIQLNSIFQLFNKCLAYNTSWVLSKIHILSCKSLIAVLIMKNNLWL